jgi:hypothetical protein
MRKSFYSLALMIVLVLGTTLAAKADSQTFTENGPGGPQTLTANTNLDWSHWATNFTLTLNGATGSYSGSCGWIGSCQITAQFTDVIKGITYTETIVGQMNWGWLQFDKNPRFVQASEESSLFELMAAALALVLVLPLATKLRRPVQA